MTISLFPIKFFMGIFLRRSLEWRDDNNGFLAGRSKVAGFFAGVTLSGFAGCGAAPAQYERVATQEERARCYAALDNANGTLRVVEAVFATSTSDLSDEVLERVATAMGMSADGIDGSCGLVSEDDPEVSSRMKGIRSRQKKIAEAALFEKSVRRAEK